MTKKLTLGIAYPAFIGAFQNLFQDDIIDLSKYAKSRTELLGILDRLDLVIFSGGEDIHPRIYNSSITYTGGINEFRDEIELQILKESQRKNKKIFGVCRGHQLINAYNGGMLAQDLKAEGFGLHSNPHKISWRVNSDLKEIFPTVNSLHHQGVISTGSNLKSLATKDRIVEATLSNSGNILSVQWHPEFMADKYKATKEYLISWINNKEKPSFKSTKEFRYSTSTTPEYHESLSIDFGENEQPPTWLVRFVDSVIDEGIDERED
jgi:putative glutamine amidotransferase